MMVRQGGTREQAISNICRAYAQSLPNADGAQVPAASIVTARSLPKLVELGLASGAITRSAILLVFKSSVWRITMRTINFHKILFVSLLSVATSVGAQAGAGPMDGLFGRELFRAEHLASELELNETQRSAVDRLMDQAWDQARPYARQLMEQRKAMRALKHAETFDESAVRAQAVKGAALMTELIVIRARSEVEVRKLLTPQQREKMEKMHDRHHGKHGAN